MGTLRDYSVNCPYCGKRIPEDSLVCDYCGNMLDRKLIEEMKQYDRRSRKSKRITAVLPIVLAVVALAAVAAFASIKILVPKDHEDRPPQQEIQVSQNTQDSEQQDIGKQDSEQQDVGKQESEQQDVGKQESEQIETEGSASEEIEIDESVYYFKAQLEKEERLLYDGLLKCAGADDPSQPGETIKVSVRPSSEEFDHELDRAYDALISDHPELFWIAATGSGVNYTYQENPSQDGTYPVSFRILEPLDERIEMMEALEASCDELLQDIDLTQPDQDIALLIHDKLIDLVTYDNSANTEDQDLAHTAYGALVENSSGDRNTAVCDGYSRAYEYLLQKAGITCITISGVAGDDEGSADKHTWNMVRLGNDWYETDCTWDDTDFYNEGDDEIVHEALEDSYYLNTLRHYLFQVTTEQMSYFDPGEDYRYYSENGWASFLNSSVHIRNTEEESEETRDFMTPLAPIAEGTEFSYAEIR